MIEGLWDMVAELQQQEAEASRPWLRQVLRPAPPATNIPENFPEGSGLAPELISEPVKKHSMPQVSITLDDSVIQECDTRAQQVGLSRSKWISNLIVTTLYNVDQTDIELDKMSLEIENLRAILAERDRLVYETQAHKHYLEGQVQRLDAQLNQLLLPAPRPGFWARLFGRDE